MMKKVAIAIVLALSMAVAVPGSAAGRNEPIFQVCLGPDIVPLPTERTHHVGTIGEWECYSRPLTTTPEYVSQNMVCTTDKHKLIIAAVCGHEQRRCLGANLMLDNVTVSIERIGLVY
jgi:hypothetical protein